jgi:hypothetical protein
MWFAICECSATNIKKLCLCIFLFMMKIHAIQTGTVAITQPTPTGRFGGFEVSFLPAYRGLHDAGYNVRVH